MLKPGEISFLNAINNYTKNFSPFTVFFLPLKALLVSVSSPVTHAEEARLTTFPYLLHLRTRVFAFMSTWNTLHLFAGESARMSTNLSVSFLFQIIISIESWRRQLVLKHKVTYPFDNDREWQWRVKAEFAPSLRSRNNLLPTLWTENVLYRLPWTVSVVQRGFGCDGQFQVDALPAALSLRQSISISVCSNATSHKWGFPEVRTARQFYTQSIEMPLILSIHFQWLHEQQRSTHWRDNIQRGNCGVWSTWPATTLEQGGTEWMGAELTCRTSARGVVWSLGFRFRRGDCGLRRFEMTIPNSYLSIFRFVNKVRGTRALIRRRRTIVTRLC